MSNKCVVCKQPEFYWHGNKKKLFTSKKDFMCSRCTLISCHTPRVKGEHIPRDLSAEIDDLANSLLGE